MTPRVQGVGVTDRHSEAEGVAGCVRGSRRARSSCVRV